MPEGPEIKLAADQVAQVLLDCRLTKVYFGLKPLKQYEQVLCGQRVVNLKTRGKAMLIEFEKGLTMYSHNQLYGRWEVVKTDQFPDTKRTLRVALHTKMDSALLFSASDIAILNHKEVQSHVFLSRIGPDILDENLHWSEVAQRLNLPEFRNRRLASLYLDQRFLAGVGNYLRSEILFHARLGPFTKPLSLTQKECNRLGESTLKLSWQSYRTKGVTNSEVKMRELKKTREKL